MENNCLALLLPTSHVLQKQLQAACRIPRLQRAQVKAPLPQANSSQGGGDLPWECSLLQSHCIVLGGGEVHC